MVDPLDNETPPVEALYQSIVSPAPGVAARVILPMPQRDALVLVGADGISFIIAVTGDRDSEIQPEVVLRANA